MTIANSHVFISHSSKDDNFVRELRDALEGLGISTWVDSRELVGGSKLAPEIEGAIERSRQFVVVLSANTVDSPWVRKEIQKALEVERRHQGHSYRVIPLLLADVEPAALVSWFGEEPVGIRVEVKVGGLSEAMPQLLAALGERLPVDRQPFINVEPRPVEELILTLSDMRVEESDGARSVRAVAKVVYEPAGGAARQVESGRYAFTAPLGPIEVDELRWYLEEYIIWPVGVFRDRAERIEAKLPRWGQELYQAALGAPDSREALLAWQQAGVSAERRFTVLLDPEPLGETDEAERTAVAELATDLLSLPWELLHDGRGFLFRGAHAVRVRRRLPNLQRQPVRPTQLPVRILMVSPRPDADGSGHIDHRISAMPLVEMAESLGELARLTVLTPPTFPALEEALLSAEQAGTPYDVVHFDGHGVYDHRVGLGGVCFEDPGDVQKPVRRAAQLVYANDLAGIMRDHHINLVFLEACQTAQTQKNPTASVAATLLKEGVASVVAMSHTVLVETAQRFVRAFYRELAEGKRVGAAMIAGQRELFGDTGRGKMPGAGEIHLQDWFVPVLYQAEQDPQLITRLPAGDLRQLEARKRRLSLGDLPAPPPHDFIGRSRELLALERLLQVGPYAVIRGQGGEGKTTLAVELARWLVRLSRLRRAAFVSLEQYTDTRGVLDSLGRQLLPNWTVAQYPDLSQALQPVERALRERPTIIVLDNLESVLPDGSGRAPVGAAPVGELFGLCEQLLAADPSTRIVFTSREPLPAPFDESGSEIALGALDRDDAVRLVSEVMKREGLSPRAEDLGGDPREVTELVELVNQHARALVLLSREVARHGVRATAENLHHLLAKLDSEHPGDRENSLYASVELSLRRLPEGLRERARVLGVCHRGVEIDLLGWMLGEDDEAASNLARHLTEAGLVTPEANGGYLRFDPALAPYLLREMSETEREEALSRWAKVMKGIAVYLHQERSGDALVTARLGLLELPNLMGLLRWAGDNEEPEEVVRLAATVEGVLSYLGLPQAMAVATALRESAARRLTDWGRARFTTESANVHRLTEQGQLAQALAAAEQLLQHCLTAGEGAYKGATYDIAIAHAHFGKVLGLNGAAEEALLQLGEARRRFQALAEEGHPKGARMAGVMLAETADCLRDLGHLDEAAAAYLEVINHSEQIGDWRETALEKSQLGFIRRQQRRYREALEIYEEARLIFDALNDPRTVAAMWQMTAAVHKDLGQHEQAERALQQALALNVQQKNTLGEADSLFELGQTYKNWGRLEEAVKCQRQAADIYVKLGSKMREGTARSDLGDTLVKLQRYDEARRELLRAVECKRPYGNAGEIWKTWDILRVLEQAVDNAEASAHARLKALESYLAYRRDGGQGGTRGTLMCAAVAEGIARGDTSNAERQLTEQAEEDVPQHFRLLLGKLGEVLRGGRDPSLSADPNLYYADAVELRLLLEKLEAQ